MQTQLRETGLQPPSAIHYSHALMGAVLLQIFKSLAGKKTPQGQEAEGIQEPARLECQWDCDGPFGRLCADMLGLDRVRVSIGEKQTALETYGQGLGRGLFQVSSGAARSLVESHGRVADDLSRYLQRSEQRHAAIRLSVQLGIGEEGLLNVQSAAAYLVEVLPSGLAEQDFRLLQQQQAQMDVLGPLSQWALSSNASMACAEMAKIFLMTDAPKLNAEGNVRSYCTCSAERVRYSLGLLSSGELQALQSETDDEKLLVSCHFCGAEYQIEASSLQTD